jgi:hypothetical protein
MSSPYDETPDMAEELPKIEKKSYELEKTSVVTEENDKAVGEGENKNETPLATMAEVFSFAETTQTKVYIGLGFFFSVISGLALPASIFFFSAILGDISAIGEEGLEPVLEIVYTMMVLGCVSLVSETLQCK